VSTSSNGSSQSPTRRTGEQEDTHGFDSSPEGTTNAQIASYSSLLEHRGRLYLFYNDSKCYVLFKDMTEIINKTGRVDSLPQETNRHAIAL
jgi:hypothetical protein